MSDLREAIDALGTFALIVACIIGFVAFVTFVILIFLSTGAGP